MILIGALGVHIQRRSDIGVPEPLLRHFGRGSLADQQGRRSSPQIMERQFGNPSFLGSRLEDAASEVAVVESTANETASRSFNGMRNEQWFA